MVGWSGFADQPGEARGPGEQRSPGTPLNKANLESESEKETINLIMSICASGQIKRQLEQARISRCGRRRRIKDGRAQWRGGRWEREYYTLIGLVRAGRRKG